MDNYSPQTEAERILRLEQQVQDLQAQLSQKELSLQTLNNVLIASHFGIFVYNREVRFAYVTPEGAKALDLTVAEMQGKNWRELNMPPSFAEPIEANIRKVFVSGQPFTGQTTFINEWGVRTYDYFLAPVIDPSTGEVEMVVSTVRDISRRTQREVELRQSKERFFKIFHKGPLATAITTQVEGRVVEVNKRFEEMLGLQRDEIIGHTSTELGLWDNSVEAEQAGSARLLQALTAGAGHVSELETTLRTKTGEPRQILISMETLELEGVPCVLSMALDITKRKEDEKALRKWADIFQHTLSGVSVSDPFTNIFTLVNPAHAQMHGYTNPQELIGKSIREVTAPHFRGIFDSRIADTLEKGYGVYESFHQRQDGTIFPVEVAVTIVKDESGKARYRVATVQDITQRFQAEEVLRQKDEQLRQAQRLEAVGQLAGGVAHDFNNLLTVIISYTQLALMELQTEAHPEWADLAETIEEVQRAGKRAADLTRQLLAFSHKAVLQPKVLNLNQIVTDMSKMISRVIGEDIIFSIQTDEELGQIEADPGQIEQVLMNLVVNARDAMPRGGKLTIETANVFLDEEYARSHDSTKPGAYVSLKVSDTGEGMTPETVSRIFEPFFTTKEVGKGTGLGLATVYGIVKQSRGNIWVTSEIGQGSTFNIYLPRYDQPALLNPGDNHLQPEATNGEGAANARRKTILLVEDEEKIRKLARRILEHSGYTVLEASNGTEAVGVCLDYRHQPRHGKQEIGAIELLVTDVIMPGIGGQEIANKLKKLYPDLKVLYMSGYTDRVIVQRDLIETGTAFLQKPFTLEGLLEKVRECLGQ